MASWEHISFSISNRLLKPAKNNRHAMTVRMSSEIYVKQKLYGLEKKTFKNVTC